MHEFPVLRSEEDPGVHLHRMQSWKLWSRTLHHRVDDALGDRCPQSGQRAHQQREQRQAEGQPTTGDPNLGSQDTGGVFLVEDPLPKTTMLVFLWIST